MSFGQDFLKGFFGSDYLKDYRHAAKTFNSNGSELLPRQKFLFHVYFTLNVDQIPSLKSMFSADSTGVLSLMVKSVQLPTFRMAIEEMNQYNRKRLVQTKLEYDPVQLTLHDDSADMVRKLWYNYYTYYYKDAVHRYELNDTSSNGDATPAGFNYNDRGIYDNERLVNDWGYVGEAPGDTTFSKGGKPPFFRDIKIFGLSQHKYAEYVLINPLIESWQHDEYDYSRSEGLTNTVTIKYETVKYREGAINGATGAPIPGFASDNYYDKEASALGRPGSPRSILGPGGLLDAGAGIVNDLTSGNFIGALQKAGRSAETFKGADLRSIINTEARDSLNKVLRGGIGDVRQSPNNRGGFSFPKPPTASSTNTSSTGPIIYTDGTE